MGYIIGWGLFKILFIIIMIMLCYFKIINAGMGVDGSRWRTRVERVEGFNSSLISCRYLSKAGVIVDFKDNYILYKDNIYILDNFSEKINICKDQNLRVYILLKALEDRVLFIKNIYDKELFISRELFEELNQIDLLRKSLYNEIRFNRIFLKKDLDEEILIRDVDLDLLNLNFFEFMKGSEVFDKELSNGKMDLDSIMKLEEKIIECDKTIYSLTKNIERIQENIQNHEVLYNKNKISGEKRRAGVKGGMDEIKKLRKLLSYHKRLKKSYNSEIDMFQLRSLYLIEFEKFKELILMSIKDLINYKRKEEKICYDTVVDMINTIIGFKFFNDIIKQKLIEYFLFSYQFKWLDYNKENNIVKDLKIIHKSYNILFNYIKDIKENSGKIKKDSEKEELSKLFKSLESETICNVVVSNILNLKVNDYINQTEFALNIASILEKRLKEKFDLVILSNFGIYLIDIVIRKTQLINKIVIQRDDKVREIVICLNPLLLERIEYASFNLKSYLPFIVKPNNCNDPYFTKEMNYNYEGILHKSVENVGETNLCEENFTIINYLNQQEMIINKDLLNFIEDEYNKPVSSFVRKKHPRSDHLKNLHYFKNKALIKEILNVNNIYFQDYNTFIIAKLLQNSSIYFLHYYDWRGRIYVLQNYLSYQSNDMARSLLLFKNGSLITEHNEELLAIHGATTYGLNKKSYNKRVEFIYNNQDLILNLDYEFIKTAEEPFQFYAFCIEWKKYMEAKKSNEQYYSGLILFFDCTSSGLQHLASIIESNTLAKQVNLLASTKDEDPYDIYEICANMLNEQFKGTIYEHILINRSLLKKPIMTKSYNITLQGTREYVMDLFFDKVWDKESNKYVFIAKKIKEGFEPKKLTNKDITVITEAVYKILFTLNPELNDLLNYFNDMVKVLNKLNKPLIWITPNNMKITQKYHKFNTKRIKLYSLEKAIKLNEISLSFPTNELNKIKQVKSFMPNHVHSIDGSMAQLILLAAKSLNVNIVTIHDCFGTTVDNIPIMNELVKNSFIKIYLDGKYLEKLHNSLLEQINSYTKIYLENYKQYILVDKTKIYIPTLPKKGYINFMHVKESIYLIC